MAYNKGCVAGRADHKRMLSVQLGVRDLKDAAVSQQVEDGRGRRPDAVYSEVVLDRSLYIFAAGGPPLNRSFKNS